MGSGSGDRRSVSRKRVKVKRSGSRRRRTPLNPFALTAATPAKIADFYKPLKKPVTLRLDADVLAWFKKDGRRYQTRINAALRKVMEREIRTAG